MNGAKKSKRIVLCAMICRILIFEWLVIIRHSIRALLAPIPQIYPESTEKWETVPPARDFVTTGHRRIRTADFWTTQTEHDTVLFSLCQTGAESQQR